MKTDYILTESADLAKKAQLKLKYMMIGFKARSLFTPQQYVVFFLKYEKNLSFNVIADIMALKSSTVRWHHMNCLKKIRELK